MQVPREPHRLKNRSKFREEPRFRHSAKGFRVSAQPFEAEEAPHRPKKHQGFGMMQGDTTDILTPTLTTTAQTAPTAPTARRMGGNGAVARDEKVDAPVGLRRHQGAWAFHSSPLPTAENVARVLPDF